MRERKMPAPTASAPDRPRAAVWSAAREAATADCGPIGRPAVGSVNVVVGGIDAERPARFLHQIRLDEDVDVAVEHAVDVAHLLLGPMILHELIWMENITANLAAEGDLFFCAADLIELRLIVFHLQI